MAIWSLLNPFGWFSSGPAKLSGGNQPGPYGDGYGNAAGKIVSPETAMRLSAYWACVTLYGHTIGSLPLDLYRTALDGSRTLAADLPLYDLLRNQPCADHDAFEFWEGIGASLAVWGNAYALKQMVDDRLVALEPLRPFWMQVYLDADGAPVYRYSDPRGRQVDYRPEQIFHVRGFGFCDLVGLSPLAFHAQFLGSSIAADEVGGSLFRNGMRVSGWFRYKGGNGILNKQQQDDTRAALIEPYSGSSNAGKAGLLPGDFDWLATNMNPVDAQLLDNRRFNVEEVCRAHGVPPILAGHIAAGQTMWGSGVEHIVLAWMATGLRPRLRRIEAAISRQLIGRADRSRLKAAFDVEELLRGDNKGMADTYSQLVNNGLKTRNEVRRAIYNDPPVEGGDKLTVQGALVPIDKLGETSPQQSSNGGGRIGRLPFDRKVFDPAHHPRGADGKFAGIGAAVGSFAEQAVLSSRFEGWMEFGVVDSARFSTAAGRDLRGWKYALDAQYSRHIDRRHGPQSNDRAPVTPADFRHLPEIAAHGVVTKGGLTASQGLPAVIVKHAVAGQTYRAVFAVRKRTRRLTLHSFEKA